MKETGVKQKNKKQKTKYKTEVQNGTYQAKKQLVVSIKNFELVKSLLYYHIMLIQLNRH